MKSMSELVEKRDAEIHLLLKGFSKAKRKLISARSLPCIGVIVVIVGLAASAAVLTFCTTLSLTPFVMGWLLIATCPVIISASYREIHEYDNELFELLEHYVHEENVIWSRYDKAIDVVRVFEFYCEQNSGIVKFVKSVFSDEDEVVNRIYQINDKLSKGQELETVLNEVLSSSEYDKKEAQRNGQM